MVDAFFDYDLVFPWKILHEDELAVSLQSVCFVLHSILSGGPVSGKRIIIKPEIKDDQSFFVMLRIYGRMKYEF